MSFSTQGIKCRGSNVVQPHSCLWVTHFGCEWILRYMLLHKSNINVAVTIILYYDHLNVNLWKGIFELLRGQLVSFRGIFWSSISNLYKFTSSQSLGLHTNPTEGPALFFDTANSSLGNKPMSAPASWSIAFLHFGPGGSLYGRAYSRFIRSRMRVASSDKSRQTNLMHVRQLIARAEIT